MRGPMWWYYIDNAPGPLNVGPFDSPALAAKDAFAKHPTLKRVMTGRGAHGAFFDIAWPVNPDWEPEDD